MTAYGLGSATALSLFDLFACISTEHDLLPRYLASGSEVLIIDQSVVIPQLFIFIYCSKRTYIVSCFCYLIKAFFLQYFLTLVVIL